VLIASRRVGEAFNIYAPDKETVICSLTVKRVSSRHDVSRELTGAWANLEVWEDKEKCVLHVTERDGDTVKIRAGDKVKLFDKDKKGVICEILVTEIREHLNEHFHYEKGLECGRGARVTLGATFDDNDCVAFRTKNN